MRNWNLRFVTTEEWNQSIASRLPMRNWNIKYNTQSDRNTDGFQTTYEELKLGSNTQFQAHAMRASRLPMRNWNLSRHGNPPQPIMASRLPMRNWNFFGRIVLLCSQLRLPDYLWGIETRSWSDTQNHSGDGFQTTYEELKHDPEATPKTTAEMASRLPMRNWNFPYRLTPYPTWASRLPMRNWNFAGSSRMDWTRPLPDYLWGIETLLLVLPADDLMALASRLPMRNWNSTFWGF